MLWQATGKRWAVLERYASSVTLPIDKNPVENAIRPIVIGKNNWLFAGSKQAGRRAVPIQSLFATANSMGSPLRAGWPTPWTNSPPARTAESIRWHRLQTLRREPAPKTTLCVA